MTFSTERLISRGKFLAAAGTLALSRTIFGEDRKETVIVVGAGISGIGAAKRLRFKGYRVIVLEARQRIGGRIWTDRSLGVPFDLGASWIHGIKGNPIYKLARKHKLELFPTDFNAGQLYVGGKPLTGDQWTQIDWKLSRITQKANRRMVKAGIEESVADAIDPLLNELPDDITGRGVRYMIASMIGNEYAEDLDGLSLRYIEEGSEFPGDHVLFRNGYADITDKLAEGLDIRTGHVVQSIEHGSGGVTVQTTRGPVQGDRVIVTLPLGVLKAGGVRFQPALPEDQQAAIGRMAMGALGKIALVFPRIFWDNEMQNFGQIKADTKRMIEFYNLHPVVGKPALFTLTHGDHTRALERGPEAAAVNFAFNELKEIHGNRIPRPVGFTRTTWTVDPFAYGSYSLIPPGASASDRKLLRRPVGERLFFAGEHTNSRYPSTVHGAFFSGMRAAKEVERA